MKDESRMCFVLMDVMFLIDGIGFEHDLMAVICMMCYVDDARTRTTVYAYPDENFRYTKPIFLRYPLLAAARPKNKLPIRVLTPTNTSLRILDASSTLALTLSISIPKEGPVIRVRAQLTIGGCSTSVSHTSAVGSSMIGIVLVINLEHSKSLCLGGSGVVTAFGGLDRFAGLRGTARG